MRRFTLSRALTGRAGGFGHRLGCWLACVIGVFTSLSAQEGPDRTAREIVAEAAVQMDVDKQKELVGSLAGANADEVTLWLGKWKEGEIYLYQDAAGTDTAVILEGDPNGDEKYAISALATGMQVRGPDGTAIRVTKDEFYLADTDSSLRKVMKTVTDRNALSSPDLAKRLPAVDYMLEEGKKKFYLIGSDYVYPQTTNLVLLEYLLSKGVPLENIGGGFRKEGEEIVSAGKYTPFGHTDYQQIVSEIKQFAAGGSACVINTLNGDTNVPFFKEYAAAGLTAETCPVVSFSISEDEFRGLPAKQLVGQLGCWTYFQSIRTPANKKFVDGFQAWLKETDTPGIVKEGRVTCSPMVLSCNGVYLWKAAVEQAKSFDVEKVVAELEKGISFDGPGGTVTSQKNHHVTKNVYIGETRADGQFKILKEFKNVEGEPFLKGTFKK